MNGTLHCPISALFCSGLEMHYFEKVCSCLSVFIMLLSDTHEKINLEIAEENANW